MDNDNSNTRAFSLATLIQERDEARARVAELEELAGGAALRAELGSEDQAQDILCAVLGTEVPHDRGGLIAHTKQVAKRVTHLDGVIERCAKEIDTLRDRCVLLEAALAEVSYQLGAGLLPDEVVPTLKARLKELVDEKQKRMMLADDLDTTRALLSAAEAQLRDDPEGIRIAARHRSAVTSPIAAAAKRAAEKVAGPAQAALMALAEELRSRS